jgi:hypothetical protein
LAFNKRKQNKQLRTNENHVNPAVGKANQKPTPGKADSTSGVSVKQMHGSHRLEGSHLFQAFFTEPWNMEGLRPCRKI